MSEFDGNRSTLSKPLARGSVVRLVIERIQEAIINKELRAGQTLPSESELSASLGVGKTSVREAIKVLEGFGVVDVKQGRGTVIREDPGADVISPLVFRLLLQQSTGTDLLELRLLFEPAYSVLAMRKATETQRQRLRACVRNLEERVAEGTQTAEDDLAFHFAMLESTGNPLIMTIGETIMQLFRSSIDHAMQTIPETALRDHASILAAFESGDENALRRAIEESFQGWMWSLGDEAE